MIHYDLRCGDGHIFDGWFRSSAAFDQQAASGLIDCPICASTVVSRALMAPRLGRGAAAPVIEGSAVEAAAASGADADAPASGNAVARVEPDSAGSGAMVVGGAQAMPDQIRAVLQRIRAEVEQRCDYVGPRFAEEARAIHKGAQPRRPIYGETTPDQAEALADEGIEIARVPWVPRADG
jgi:hypothetical protein